MGCLPGRAQNSELKICVSGMSRMLVPVLGAHWWMAAVELWETNALLVAPESRDRGWRPEQSVVRLSVHRES